MDPALLIIVPTLDSFKYLPNLCSSLTQQSCANWRVLFVDGPSSSRHRNWLDEFCSSDSRFSWIPQDPLFPGIFGAMNQGFHLATINDWLLFWGSDDWASAPQVLDTAMSTIKSADLLPDLIVCQGRYICASSGRLGRVSHFMRPGVFNSTAFRSALFFGSTPSHQATLFGPGSRARLNQYSSLFRLSADLDYFLQLSKFVGLSVRCLNLELVYMGDEGVSGKQTQRRLQEVQRAYRRSFGWLWWFPFLARYIRRLVSLMPAFL